MSEKGDMVPNTGQFRELWYGPKHWSVQRVVVWSQTVVSSERCGVVQNTGHFRKIGVVANTVQFRELWYVSQQWSLQEEVV